MNKFKMSAVCILFAAMFLAAVPAIVQAQTPQEMLRQYVAELQNNPGDNALREKIIKLVLTMNSPPEVPAEAKKHISRGVAAIEGAKNPDDFKDACNEFQQVTTLAPWLGNGYRNLAIAQDKAGMYSAALQSLNLYLLTQPARADVEWAEDLKNKVEYRKEKAVKESSPEAIEAKKQNEHEEWLKKIDGRRYMLKDGKYMTPGTTGVLDVKGKFLIEGIIVHPGSPLEGPRGYSEHKRYEIQGREARYEEYVSDAGVYLRIFFIISEDGDKITYESHWGNNPPRESIYLWER